MGTALGAELAAAELEGWAEDPADASLEGSADGSADAGAVDAGAEDGWADCATAADGETFENDHWGAAALPVQALTIMAATASTATG